LIEITIPLRSHDEAILVLGPYDRYAKLLRQDLDVELSTRRGNLRIRGEEDRVQEARRRIEHLLGKSRKGRELPLRDLEAILLGADTGEAAPAGNARTGGAPARTAPSMRAGAAPRVIRPGSAAERAAAQEDGGAEGAGGIPRVRGSRLLPVQPRTENQRRYIEHIEKHPLVFGVGPAGTGKTFLAVAAAVRKLRSGECRRLVITRPVVEAGERLGFLPGDLQAKLNPYMRPIYDALYDLLDFEEVGRLEETGVIEIAPLAYMRGRTLSHAFAILDEGQNTTVSQMRMFLTRLGEGSRMVVTGDPSQSDLEGNQKSGLNDAILRLRGFQDISVLEFNAKDIVRHPLVESIVRAYEAPPRDRREGERAP
jgi:phosphate starvation-inducible protein PhoH and related proteins